MRKEEKKEKKTIYLVVSSTGTFPSKIIQFFTKDKYTHVSISLKEDLTEMYSFGRRYLYLPLPGGFVRENRELGVYKRFKNTTSKVISLQVRASVYDSLQERLHNMYEEKKKYGYNLYGLILAKFGVYKKRKNHYYCSEFVQEVLDECGIGLSEHSPIVRPMDFLGLKNGEICFDGLLRMYPQKG